MKEYEHIRLEKNGPVYYLVLNRPERFNALAKQTVNEMIDAFQGLKTDPNCRVLIIRGEGKHFCTGHDLSELTGGLTVDYLEIFSECSVMMQLLHDLPQPVIAQVHGIATAAGCQLTAACDLAVAEENAIFATPGVKIGLFCSTPMTPLVRAIGRKKSMEMLLTGRNVSALEAEKWGLLNRVVPKEDLASETKLLAESMIQASPLTLELGKKTFYQTVDLSESAAYDLAGKTMTMNLTTLDAQEGIKAFLEKRKPNWSGK